MFQAMAGHPVATVAGRLGALSQQAWRRTRRVERYFCLAFMALARAAARRSAARRSFGLICAILSRAALSAAACARRFCVLAFMLMEGSDSFDARVARRRAIS